MSFLTEKKGSRGGALLLLFLLTLSLASNAIGSMPNTPGKLGAMLPSLCLLGSGIWFAFKEGGWLSKGFAAVVLTLTVCFFGRGLERAFQHHESAQEIDTELDQMRAEVAKGDVSMDAAKQRLDHADAATARMQASKNSETVELGHAVEVVATMNREMSSELTQALESVQSERFVNVKLMIERDDFEWQHKTANDYLSAAKSTAIANETLPDTAFKRLTQAGVELTSAQGVVKGMQRIQPFNARALQAHIRSATACGKMIDFVESHRAEITMHDGVVRLETRELLDAYNLLQKELTASQTALNAAIKQGMKAAGG